MDYDVKTDAQGYVTSMTVAAPIEFVEEDGSTEIIIPETPEGAIRVTVPDDFDIRRHRAYKVDGGSLVVDQDRLDQQRREVVEAERRIAAHALVDEPLFEIMQRNAAMELVQTAQADRVIGTAVLGYLPEWAEGKHAIDAVVTYDGQPYRCAQAHDSTGNPGWTPTATPALWANYHAQSAEMALPWVAPSGAHDAYQTGEWMIWTDGEVYRCKVNNTVHGPDVLPGAWEQG